jgi:hypothetical protein
MINITMIIALFLLSSNHFLFDISVCFFLLLAVSYFWSSSWRIAWIFQTMFFYYILLIISSAIYLTAITIAAWKTKRLHQIFLMVIFIWFSWTLCCIFYLAITLLLRFASDFDILEIHYWRWIFIKSIF